MSSHRCNLLNLRSTPGDLKRGRCRASLVGGQLCLGSNRPMLKRLGWRRTESFVTYTLAGARFAATNYGSISSDHAVNVTASTHPDSYSRSAGTGKCFSSSKHCVADDLSSGNLNSKPATPVSVTVIGTDRPTYSRNKHPRTSKLAPKDDASGEAAFLVRHKRAIK